MTSVLIDAWSVRMMAARACEASPDRRFKARYRRAGLQETMQAEEWFAHTRKPLARKDRALR